MKTFARLLLLLALMTGAMGCGFARSNGSQPSPPASSDPDAAARFKTEFLRWSTAASAVAYRVKASPKDAPVAYEGKLEWRRASTDRERIDVNGDLEGRTVQLALLATTKDWITVCSQDSGDFPDVTPVAAGGLCIHGDSADNAADVLMLLLDLPTPFASDATSSRDDPLAGWMVRAGIDRTISGRHGNCFALSARPGAATGSSAMSICYSSDQSGLLLYRQETLAEGGSIVFEATEVLSPPVDSDFVPPYQVVEK